ncbi:UNKNOWN [Stylonychia lemnae]|uniref:Uncharacterized protein n=1 Tax=Stylonychia lemnae TaxID=5949 RepID=A0A078A0R4_STYLE|nr:UNKNOWN [Stylonychia lemnae]|eukprot:CDW75447.1 UNKNOWN [Stylonychia lemnae]
MKLNNCQERQIHIKDIFSQASKTFKDSIKLLSKTSGTIDTAFEKSKTYKGEFEESKGGGVRPFDQYFETNNTLKMQEGKTDHAKKQHSLNTGEMFQSVKSDTNEKDQIIDEFDLKKKYDRESPEMGSAGKIKAQDILSERIPQENSNLK